jgi:KDO2-lipid IV(A) lauroyltransferase
MSRPRSQFIDWLVYLLVRVIVCIIQALPYRVAVKLSAGLAWLVHRVDKRHRLVAEENLRHAYGDQLTQEQRDEMVRAVYTHFCRLLIELIHLTRRLHPNNWRRYVELIGGDRITEALISPRPLLFVTGHFGNWEIAGYALGLLGFRTHAIARTLDNVYLDRYLRSFRERTGQRILAKTGEFDEIQEVLERGGILATLADQDAGQRGQFVEFFGRPASTHKAVALLALEYNVPILVMGTPLLENTWIGNHWANSPARYRIILSEYIDPAEYDGRPDAVGAMTQRYTSALERVIRLAPEQYFWLHRRWKHQPRQKKSSKAA